ncbi:hypothetical protein CRUP_021714 [Coryphaenoides rupestris]|nr:hypothetical protein CRUP_021714 [Coryphaenoides rupestris]
MVAGIRGWDQRAAPWPPRTTRAPTPRTCGVGGDCRAPV